MLVACSNQPHIVLSKGRKVERRAAQASCSSSTRTQFWTRVQLTVAYHAMVLAVPITPQVPPVGANSSLMAAISSISIFPAL